jgi:hypothetical protein
MWLHPSPIPARSAEHSSFAERAALNVMMTLFLFSTLVIGIMPAYLIAKPQATDRQ